MNFEEIWKDVNGFEGFYQVSNFGRVRSLDRIEEVYRSDIGLVIRPRKGRILKQKTNKYGYAVVHLRNKELEKHASVHRLVASEFLDNPENKPSVNHIDADKLNNCLWNLEWSTHTEQMQHAVQNNLLEIRGAPKYSKAYKKEMYEYFLETNCTVSELAKKFNVSLRTAGRVTKGVFARTTVKVTPNGEHVIRNILTKDEIKEIFTLREQGKTLEQIAKLFDRGTSQIHRVLNKKSRVTEIE